MNRTIGLGALVGTMVVGCGGTFRYATDDVSTVGALRGSRMAVPGVVDGRFHAETDERSRAETAKEMTQVRESVAEHVSRAGVDAVATRVELRAPADVERLLAEAAGAGVREVMFVRYHGASAGSRAPGSTIAFWTMYLGAPFFIIQSLPINAVAGVAGFEAFVVDPSTGEVLASPARLAADDETRTAWRTNPFPVMRDVMRRAMQAVLEDVAAERASGYPNRYRVRDVASYVLSAPPIRSRGGRMHGVGWSMELPGGWHSERSTPLGGGAANDRGVMLYGQTLACAGSPRWCRTFAGAMSGDVVHQEDIGDDGSAREYVVDFEDGTRLYSRIMTRGGIAFVASCSGPRAAVAESAHECRQAFDSARISVTRPE